MMFMTMKQRILRRRIVQWGLLLYATNAFVLLRNPNDRLQRTFSTFENYLKNGGQASFQIYLSSQSSDLMPMKPGSTVALVTPFDATTGHIDQFAFRRLLQYHVEQQTDNICILGTTGEASVLTMAEREQVIQWTVQEVKGRLPILVGTGSNNPTSTKAMTKQALDLGGDAALIVTPYYVKPPQRALIRYMMEMADIGLPTIVYNVPGRTGIDMTNDSIAMVASSHENIIGVKDATGDLARVPNLLEKLALQGVVPATSATSSSSSTTTMTTTTTNTKRSKNFLLYSGDDATSVDFVLAGGSGCISVTANVAAREMHLSMQAAWRGDIDTARTIDAPLHLLHCDLFCESNPIPIKYAVSRLFPNIVSDYCRPPLDRLEERYQPLVDAALRQAGVLVV